MNEMAPANYHVEFKSKPKRRDYEVPKDDVPGEIGAADDVCETLEGVIVGEETDVTEAPIIVVTSSMPPEDGDNSRNATAMVTVPSPNVDDGNIQQLLSRSVRKIIVSK